MNQPTEQQFLALIVKHPPLCAWGWWNPHQGRLMKIDLEGNRASLTLRFDEFKRSVGWLRQCQTTKTVTRTSPSSYNLKHRAEYSTGDYICNGAMIAAALYLGVPMKAFDDSPNPGIGVSKRCPVYQAAGKR